MKRYIWKYKLERPFRFQSPGRNVQTITAHFYFDFVDFARKIKKSKIILETYKFTQNYFEGC